MTKVAYDFSGLATAYDIKCTDGRTILPGAFDHQHEQAVPLVWRHQHNSASNVLGHGVLYATASGMRFKAKFNQTKEGQHAKQLVEGQDIRYLSVWANNIQQDRGGLVRHGSIREVSLVMVGANPGASIDEVIKHSDDPFEPDVILEDEAIIHSGVEIELIEEVEEVEETQEIEEVEEVEETQEIEEVEETQEIEEVEETQEIEAVETDGELRHADGEETLQDILETLNEDQTALFDSILSEALNVEHEEYDSDLDLLDMINALSDSSDEGPTANDVYESLNEKQKNVLHMLVSEAEENLDSEEEETTIAQSDVKTNNHIIGEQQTMTTNIFENGETRPVMSHDEMNNIIVAAAQRKANSLKEEFIAHAGTTYGVHEDSVELLFPDAQAVDGQAPKWYTEDMEWVEAVVGMARPVPFSRIKSLYSDITADRAHGYVTGTLKVEDVISVLKRETTPTTVYKKQKMDRDDVIDITDFDVVVWLKGEMRMMLRMELARAFLISDGRNVVDSDKISETNIRPIWTDSDVYAHKVALPTTGDILDVIDAITAARVNYRGSGNPTLFTSPTHMAEMLLVRDLNGRRIYDTIPALAAALRVKTIVEVPAMENQVRDDEGTDRNLFGIVVNMRDYVVGANKGGQTSFFDQFDIDYNQMKYLYETRICAALTSPKSALVLEIEDVA